MQSPEEFIEEFRALSKEDKSEKYLEFCNQLVIFQQKGLMTIHWAALEMCRYLGIKEIHAKPENEEVLYKSERVHSFTSKDSVSHIEWDELVTMLRK
jgi:hypothetical protein